MLIQLHFIGLIVRIPENFKNISQVLECTSESIINDKTHTIAYIRKTQMSQNGYFSVKVIYLEIVK